MVTNFLKEPRKEGISDDEWMWKRNMKIGTWKNGRDKRRILQFIRAKYKSNSQIGH